MRLTTKGRYAVTAMLDLAINEARGPIRLAAISRRQGISLSYLEQLFTRLRKQQLVRSTRGPGGGYSLNRPANEIAVAEIIAALPPDMLAKSEVAAAVSAFELEQQTADSGDLQELKDKVDAAPGDHQARLDYAANRYSLGGELIYSDERDDVDGITFRPTKTDAYTLINLHGSYDLDPHWQLFGKIDNLLDTDYELASRYNTPGRTLSVGIRYDTD